jgi:hypothetical protein
MRFEWLGNERRLTRIPVQSTRWTKEIAVRIVSARTHAGTYWLTLGLSDGSYRTVDVESLLWGPVFEPLIAERALFDKASVDPHAETVVWPNGADIAPETLLDLAPVTTSIA